MRRSAIVLCALAALCVGGIAAAHACLVGTADEVAFRETTYAGDLAAAEGLTLTAQQSCARQLYWESVVPVAAPERARTEFTALASQKPAETRQHPEGLSMGVQVGGASYHFGSGVELSALPSMMYGTHLQGGDDIIALLMPVAERTEAGDVHEETFRARDYLEYLPLYFDLELGGRTVPYWNGRPYVPGDDTSGLSERLADCFRIPTPEDLMLTVRVSKNRRGQVETLETEASSGGAATNMLTFGLETYSVVTEGKCWFALSGTGDEPLDFSELQGGCGLYCLPFATRETADEFGNKKRDVDADALHNAFPFAEGETPVDLRDGGDGTLLLTLRSPEGLTLVVLDAMTERALQRLPLFAEAELGEEDWVAAPVDGWFYAACDARVRFYERGADGCYTLLLDVPGGVRGALPEELSPARFTGPRAVAWDGERLAVIVAAAQGFPYTDFQTGEMRTGGGLLLAVYDASGLRYCGRLQSGLMDGRSGYLSDDVLWGEYDYAFGRQGETGLALSFDGGRG